MIAVRHTLRMGRDLVRFGWRTGLWWLPVLVPVLAVAAIAIAAAKAAVPVALYVFF